jgi:hypothetical protein
MSNNISQDTIISRTKGKDVVYSDLDDELIILLDSAGKVCSLNQTARYIWLMLAEDISFGEICTQLRQTYIVGEQECRIEVTRLVKHLKELGLVTI